MRPCASWFTPTRVGISATAVHDRTNRVGSPPRVWGSAVSASGIVPNPVHPHACGDQAAVNLALCVDPRFTPTRVGIRSLHESLVVSIDRFTPTRVGISSVRGSPLTGMLRGSPPHVWGSGTSWPLLRSSCRFTPTRVGIRYSQSASGHGHAVHPHTCGDQVARQRPSHPAVHPHACGDQADICGIELHRSVHPHACGDQADRSCGEDADHGSPPHVWGSGYQLSVFGANTTGSPHTCGDQCGICASFLSCAIGSPPRVWGIRARVRQSCL